ncbi:MAG: DUF2461 domain-containing protein [Candidatus Limnocylindrales bacterium]
MATSTSTFPGFRPEAVQFLADLGANNERAWFQPRKGDYERLLKEPLEALVAALAERFAGRGLPLRADPSRSPFRIYRDVRFSKDKSPYKTNIGADFPWVEPAAGATADSEPRHGMGGYFHLSPGEIYVGGGMWHPEPARLAAWRRLVVADPKVVHRAIEERGFVKEFRTVDGERLKRVPQGFGAAEPDAELLKLKDVTFGRRLADSEAFSPELPDLIADAFDAATPVFRLLAGLEG